MSELSGRYPLSDLLECAGLARSSYYYALSHPKAPTRPELWEAAAEIFSRTANGCGHRQIAMCLRAERGVRIADKTVLKMMREMGIRGVTPNAKKRTAIPDEGAPARPDLVRRDFTSPVPTYKLVGDITYLRTGEGWLYPATVIDLNTRMVVGWSLSSRMTADIAVEALERAWRRGYVTGNAIFHSDSFSHEIMLRLAWREGVDDASIAITGLVAGF